MFETKDVLKHWRICVAIIFIVALGFLMSYKLASLMPGASKQEVAITESSNLNSIISNPNNLLFKLPVLALEQFEVLNITTLRAIGVFFGTCSLLIFYLLMKNWHTRRVALMTTGLLAIASWFLHISRSGHAYVLAVLSVLILIYIAFQIYHRKSPRAIYYLLALPILVYTPGMFWLVFATFIWRPRAFIRLINEVSWVYKILIALFGLTVLSPLIYASALDSRVAVETLALPAQFDPLEWGRRLLVLPIYLFAQGPEQPLFNLGRLPLLDVFSTVMVIIGVYVYYFRLSLPRTRYLALLSIVIAILFAVSDHAFIVMLLPIAMIVAGSGIAMILQQWFTIFPKNPLARYLGVIVLVVAMGSVGYYHAKRYFIAWPGNPTAREAYIYQIEQP